MNARQGAQCVVDIRYRALQTHSQSAFIAHGAGQMIRRIVRNDLAVVDNDNTLADRLDFRQDMGRKNNGVVFAQFFNQVADLNDLFGSPAPGPSPRSARPE